jgi:DNA-binding GntR family transcriptional regulator
VARPPVPPSIRVADHLREHIRSGALRPGDQLPSVAELSTCFQTSRTTISKALRRLQVEGLVSIVPRWGVFVAPAHDA